MFYYNALIQRRGGSVCRACALHADDPLQAQWSQPTYKFYFIPQNGYHVEHAIKDNDYNCRRLQLTEIIQERNTQAAVGKQTNKNLYALVRFFCLSC